MDFFGIGSAIKATVGMYQTMSRNSGRTLQMVWALKPGDRVIFTNQKEADRVKRLCKERSIEDISFEVEGRGDPHFVLQKGTCKGRTIFDHTWVENYYAQAIDRAERDIDHFQKQLSGYGEAHIETKLAAKEYSRMMQYFPG